MQSLGRLMQDGPGASYAALSRNTPSVDVGFISCQHHEGTSSDFSEGPPT